jgi:hypothetical protein
MMAMSNFMKEVLERTIHAPATTTSTHFNTKPRIRSTRLDAPSCQFLQFVTSLHPHAGTQRFSYDIKSA